jgi:hypothetical protein
MVSVDIPEKSWNQIQDYICKWYPILIGVASLEGKKKNVFTHESIGT